MTECATLDGVKGYWGAKPVHSVEFGTPSSSKEFFDYIDALRWSDNERWARKRFYDLPGDANTRILDAGCGVGVFSRFYARKGFDVSAIDITDQAVALTRDSMAMYDLAGDVRQGSVEEIPFPDNHFDYVVSNGVIHHTPDTQAAADEFYRVLKPGGRASVCIYYRNVLLRQPLWPLVRWAIRLMLKKTEGREDMLTAKTPEDLVRTYDGNNTPIAKVYTRKQAGELFGRFRTVAVAPHYFPVRFLRGFRVGGLTHRILDRCCGTLIYYLLEKPR